jgi:hypothetical protein
MAVDVVRFAVAGVTSPRNNLVVGPVGKQRERHMDETTIDILDQADEDILIPTVSDEALEGVASPLVTVGIGSHRIPGGCCVSLEINCD